MPTQNAPAGEDFEDEEEREEEEADAEEDEVSSITWRLSGHRSRGQPRHVARQRAGRDIIIRLRRNRGRASARQLSRRAAASRSVSLSLSLHRRPRLHLHLRRPPTTDHRPPPALYLSAAAMSTTVDIPSSVQAELKKFRYRKASAGDTAIVLKIDKNALTLDIEANLDSITPEELADELPEVCPFVSSGTRVPPFFPLSFPRAKSFTAPLLPTSPERERRFWLIDGRADWNWTAMLNSDHLDASM